LYFFPNDNFVNKKKLKSIGIYPQLIPIHANIVGIDNKFLAIGSYNWLHRSEDELINLSIAIEDITSKLILEQFWEYKDKYKALIEFEEKRLKEYIKNQNNHFAQNSEPQLISQNPFHIELLITPNQHYEFLKTCFQHAQFKIVIHTCFISKDMKFLSQIIEDFKVSSFSERGGCLEILYNSESRDGEILQEALPHHLNIMWSPVKSLQSNAIIIDEGKLATVGSYNWFSSFRSFGDKWSFLEITLIFKDQAADWLDKGLGLLDA